jgi:hypothetical protein
VKGKRALLAGACGAGQDGPGRAAGTAAFSPQPGVHVPCLIPPIPRRDQLATWTAAVTGFVLTVRT